jgi:hypothetical protein
MRVLIAVVVGLVAGLVLGWSLDAPSGREGAAPSAPGEQPSGVRAEEPPSAAAQRMASSASFTSGEDDEPEHGREEARTESASDELPLFHAGLQRHARAEIARGWGEEREDAMPAELAAEALETYERSVLEGPYALGRALAVEHTRRLREVAELPADDPIELLAILDQRKLGPQTGAAASSPRRACPCSHGTPASRAATGGTSAASCSTSAAMPCSRASRAAGSTSSSSRPATCGPAPRWCSPTAT